MTCWKEYALGGLTGLSSSGFGFANRKCQLQTVGLPASKSPVMRQLLGRRSWASVYKAALLPRPPHPGTLPSHYRLRASGAVKLILALKWRCVQPLHGFYMAGWRHLFFKARKKNKGTRIREYISTEFPKLFNIMVCILFAQLTRKMDEAGLWDGEGHRGENP